MTGEIKLHGTNQVFKTDNEIQTIKSQQIHKSANNTHTNKTSEDELVEYTDTSSNTSSGAPQSEADILREKYNQAQNEYFRLQKELANLEKQRINIENRINNCKDDEKELNKLQGELLNINGKISGKRQDIQISENNMRNLNMQILNAIFEESTPDFNSQNPSNAAGSQSYFSSAPYSGESIPKDVANKLDSKLGSGFSQKCEEVAAKLNCNANDLIAMMYSESGLNPSIQGGSGSVGLIQFMPSTLSANGYSTAQVKNMSGVQQLDVVADILGKSKAMSGFSQNEKLDAGSLYAICFLPAAAKSDVLCSSSGSLSWAYSANSGLDLNSDGSISKSDLASRLNGKYAEMLKAI